MGFSAIGIGASLLYSALNQPDSPSSSVQAPPKTQASQIPDAAGTRTALTGAAQGGGAPGIAQTFLSGTGGVDPSLLQLGRNTLLGGGSSAAAPGLGG